MEKINISGLIEMPQYDSKLPFCSNFNEKNTASLPRRFSGSAYDSSLIISVSSEKGQFDFADELEINNILYLTDMEGYRYSYLISSIEHSDNVSLEKLTSKDDDLTIFVKDSMSMDYIIIRFKLK